MEKYHIVYSISRDFPKFWNKVDKYEIAEVYTYWDDPTYGNGGGSYERDFKIIFKTNNYDEAKEKIDKLREINGRKI